MSWFIYALICLLGWGCADLFYKISSEGGDEYSHLKTAVWVGIVMGAGALLLLPLSESFAPGSGAAFGAFITCAVKYLPASLSYIISMVIGYAGLRYLELSIVSPIQNASGAFSAIAMLIWFLASGKITSVRDELDGFTLTGTLLIVAGIILLAVVEKRDAPPEETPPEDRRKHITGALALIFPLLYCIFDTIGTAADGIILSESSGLGLGEIDVIILYGFTFLLAGLAIWIYMFVKTGRPYLPFAKSELPKLAAAVFEEFGQIFYVYAMASRPVITAPMVASYCIVSVILGRIFLRERPGKQKGFCILLVITGIVLLGISEGLAE